MGLTANQIVAQSVSNQKGAFIHQYVNRASDVSSKI